jgi:hypothetical protein
MHCKKNKINICNRISNEMTQFMQGYIFRHHDIIDVDNARAVIQKDNMEIGNVTKTGKILTWEFYCPANDFFKYHRYDAVGYDEHSGHYRLRVCYHPFYGSIYVK